MTDKSKKNNLPHRNSMLSKLSLKFTKFHKSNCSGFLKYLLMGHQNVVKRSLY